MSALEEGGICFENVPDLDLKRKEILTGADNPVLARDWLTNALSEGTRIQNAYRSGRFPLGEDVVKLLYGFDYENLRGTKPDAEGIQGRRRRAYHRLLDHLLANYEYGAARKVGGKLREAEEGWWRSYGDIFLWRLLAAMIAGDIALGGSSTWREMTVALAGTPPWCVCTLSLMLIIIPPVFTELFQAPSHALRNILQRLRLVWANAALFVILLGGLQWFLKTAVRPCGESWLEMLDWRYHFLSASVSLAIGYVLNLIWRERSIAGPNL